MKKVKVKVKDVYVIDKLNININYTVDENDYEAFIVDFCRNEHGIMIVDTSVINNNYNLSKSIIVNNKHIANIHISQRQNKTIHSIRIDNRALYKYSDEVKKLYSYIFLKYEYTVKKIEIARDSSANYLKKMYKKRHNLKMKKDYSLYDFGETISSDKTRTYYVKNQKNRYIKEKEKDYNHLRFENKTNELNVSSKEYVSKYHTDNNIDISKDVYRVECIVNDLSKSRTAIYYDINRVEYISEYKYKKHLQNIQDKESQYTSDELLFDIDYENSVNILDKYTDKSYMTTEYFIELTKLYDREYLATLFNHFSSDIVTNIDIVMNIENTKEKIKERKIMSTQINSNRKYVNVTDEERIIYLLSKINNISYDEAMRYKDRLYIYSEYNDVIQEKNNNYIVDMLNV